MARRNFQTVIDSGILSLGVSAILLGTTRPTINKYCMEGMLRWESLPGSMEKRIKAPDLLEFANKYKLSFLPQLKEAVTNFNNQFEINDAGLTAEKVSTGND